MKPSKKILMLAASVGLLALVTSFSGVRRAVAETVKPVLAQIVNAVGGGICSCSGYFVSVP